LFISNVKKQNANHRLIQSAEKSQNNITEPKGEISIDKAYAPLR